MKEQHPIDRFFHDQLSNRDVPYNKVDWKGAERLLNDHQKKRHFLYRFRYYLSSLLLLIISGFAFLLVSNESSKNSTSTSNHDAARIISSNTNNTNTSLENQIKLDQQSNLDAEAELISDRTRKEEIAVLSNALENAPKTETNDQKEDQIEKEIMDEESMNDGHINADLHVKEESVGNGEAWPTSSSQQNNTMQVNNHTIKYASSSVSSMNQPVFYASTTSMTNQQNTTVVNSAHSDALSQMKPLDANSNVIQDNTLEEPEPEMDKIQNQYRKTSGFSIIAGVGLTPLVETENTKSENNYSYFLGIGYEKLVLTKISLEMRLLFSRRNAFGLDHSVTQEYYDFGYRKVETNYRYNNLTYIEFPLIVNYVFHPLHQVGIGIQYSRLLSTSYNSTVLEESTFGVKNPVEISGQQSSGIFNKNDFALYLGYKYAITEKWNAGINAQLGLTNTVDENLIQNISHKNQQFRLFLTYKIRK